MMSEIPGPDGQATHFLQGVNRPRATEEGRGAQKTHDRSAQGSPTPHGRSYFLFFLLFSFFFPRTPFILKVVSRTVITTTILTNIHKRSKQALDNKQQAHYKSKTRSFLAFFDSFFYSRPIFLHAVLINLFLPFFLSPSLASFSYGKQSQI